MIVHVQEFRPGRSPLSFEIGAAEVRAYLEDIDDTWSTQDAQLTFDGEIDRLNETLHIRGELRASLRETCSRCLREQDHPVVLPVRWTLLPIKTLDTRRLKDNEEVELSTDDLDTSFYKGDEIAIGELVREALLLELDPAPVCGKEDCDERFQALMSKALRTEDIIDPRWEKLAALKNNLKPSGQD